ncbi:malate synthase A [Sutcliffiella halmapala]|uniref:malate synthase A n=1 Tax=Sutcliffiella halmapala TaxID=79882 RepID=UPI0009950211|nr:malate synthase A [Sutcliffiella halmapala]
MNAGTSSIVVTGEWKNGYEAVLTQEALSFIEKLHTNFNQDRKELLEKRKVRQQEIDEGVKLDFLESTSHIRQGDWQVGPIPLDLQDRRVEITGPVDRKMIIHALNSGAKVFMADFEDATSPTWSNLIEGQLNLRDAIRRSIDFRAANGKEYKLKEEIATLLVRPRGWHLEEKHILINQEPISASLFDFGLYFYHNVKQLLANGSGPYFYLPKLESHLEARLWNDVFVFAQQELGIAQGTIKATVLIETITAAFEMDEILYELKEHAAGLNCGRWDYIFSFIKKFRNTPSYLLPERSQVTMTVPFMRAYTQLVIQTCHKRGAHAIGGMAAQIPVKNDEKANGIAFSKVREDKLREVKDGHDGTWVAHPALVPVALEVFNEHMKGLNQLDRKREDVKANAAELVQLPAGTITEDGLRKNIHVGMEYITAWLDGNGAVPIFHLMEDAATAEISRSQVWQWVRHPEAKIESGTKITIGLVKDMIQEEKQAIQQKVGPNRFKSGTLEQAAVLFEQLIEDDEFVEFLTLPAYRLLED